MRKYLTSIIKYLMWFILIITTWTVAVVAGRSLISVSNTKIETIVSKVCPYCNSKKFPPFCDENVSYAWRNWKYPILVYRCEDCFMVWGPRSEEWLVEYPDPKDWLVLIPPDNRDIYIKRLENGL